MTTLPSRSRWRATARLGTGGKQLRSNRPAWRRQPFQVRGSLIRRYRRQVEHHDQTLNLYFRLMRHPAEAADRWSACSWAVELKGETIGGVIGIGRLSLSAGARPTAPGSGGTCAKARGRPNRRPRPLSGGLSTNRPAHSGRHPGIHPSASTVKGDCMVRFSDCRATTERFPAPCRIPIL